VTVHRLILKGGTQGDLKLPASILLEAVGALVEGARLATRFAVEGESVRKGPRPAWLDAACDFTITGLASGSAVISVEARTLRDVDESRFGPGYQQTWVAAQDDRLGERTAIDLFGEVLTSIVRGTQDEVVADRALLEGCARFARISGGGFSGLLLDGLQGRQAPLEISPEDAPLIEQIRDRTPRPQAMRITGILDTVSVSRSDIVLVLQDGTRLPGRTEQLDIQVLRTLLGSDVVVSGMALYRPSGRLHLIDVESLEVARPEDKIFERVTLPRQHRLNVESDILTTQGSMASFFGTWPGDETDEELLSSLRALT
jgi:hypothetical protein